MGSFFNGILFFQKIIKIIIILFMEHSPLRQEIFVTFFNFTSKFSPVLSVIIQFPFFFLDVYHVLENLSW